MNKQMPSEDRYTDAPPDIAEEIKASVAIRDDFPSPDELRRELKRSVTIRLDPDVYAWFQLPGPGYQTRINAVLRRYMEQWKTGKAEVQPVAVGKYSTTTYGVGSRGAGKIAAKKAPAKAAVGKPSKKGTFVLRTKKAAKAKKTRASPPTK